MEIKGRMKRKGYTVDELARRSGVPMKVILGAAEEGTRGIEKSMAERLDSVLNPAAKQDMPQGAECIIREAVSSYGADQAVDRGKETEGYTLKEYEKLSEQRNLELIDGMLFEMNAPDLNHQDMAFILGELIRNYIRKKKGECRMYLSPEVRPVLSEQTIVQPDIAVICDRNKLMKKRVEGAPDFVIEILSPSTREKDLGIKLRKYREAKVREYWAVDLEKERVITYFFEENDMPLLYGLGALVPVRIFGEELKIDFSKVMRELPAFDPE